jgi:hypothetical protein
MRKRKYYRMLRDKDGLPTTLFHAVNGSKKVPLDEWIEAIVKEAWDGSKTTAKRYMSGFHVLPTLDDIVKFSGKFRKREDLVICPVWVDEEDMWDKEHSPADVKLVKKMMISSKQWENRIRCLTLNQIADQH